MLRAVKIVLYSVFIHAIAFSQQFETIPTDFISGTKPLRFGNIVCTSRGSTLIAYSLGLAEIDKLHIELVIATGFLADNKGNNIFKGRNPNILKDQFDSITGIKLICEGPDGIIYVLSNNSNFGCINYNLSKAIEYPPFNFPNDNSQREVITKIWIDKKGVLFVATNCDTIYSIVDATKLTKTNSKNKLVATYMTGLDKDSNLVVSQGALAIKKFSLGVGIIPTSFAENPEDSRAILIGTNHGLYGYDKQTGQSINYLKDEKESMFTITDIEANRYGSVIWFSTLEKGMGRFNKLTKTMFFFRYPKKLTPEKALYPIKTFSRKSGNEFYVAVADSLPAVFNTETGKYSFIDDTIFHHTANTTTDIKADAFGNLFISKGGGFYWSKSWLKNLGGSFKTDTALFGPFITDILINGLRYSSRGDFYSRNESLKEIILHHDENNIEIYYSNRGINADSLEYSWKLDNFNNEWKITPFSVFGDGLNMVNFDNVSPGRYVFHVKSRKINEAWLNKQVMLTIIIEPAFWQTWWFWSLVTAGTALGIFLIFRWRINVIRKHDRIKSDHEKELLELEAKALRAQMNPHFIFNCMNSIKSLIQQKEDDKAVLYLTTFSKLIRTIFNNSDKREISLFDELETCKLYVQLESMRFRNKFKYNFNIDETIDLKSVHVPALIVQPFIENSIWHGIMPKEEGGYVNIAVKRADGYICCIIDDNGIGRETSRQNKFKGDTQMHQSKGVHLTQSRLSLNNLLNGRKESVEITDKNDERGKSAGTKVVLIFNEY